MEIIDVTQPVNVGWLICDGLAPKKQKKQSFSVDVCKSMKYL